PSITIYYELVTSRVGVKRIIAASSNIGIAHLGLKYRFQFRNLRPLRIGDGGPIQKIPALVYSTKDTSSDSHELDGRIGSLNIVGSYSTREGLRLEARFHVFQC